MTRPDVTRLAVALIAPMALAGCVRVATPPPLATPIPAAYAANIVSGATATDADIEVLPTWWHAFHDPQLDTLIAGALRDSPDLKTVEARVAEADATLSRALRRFDPQGGLAANDGARTVRQLSGDINLPNLPVDVPLVQTGTTRVRNAAFNVSWEADVFGRRNATAVVARSRVYSARLQAASSRASLTAAIADALFTARGLAVEREAARAALAIEREAASLLDRRIARGLVPAAERNPTNARLRAASLQVDALSTELDVARRQLLVLVGRGTAPLDDLIIAPHLGDAPVVPRTTPGDLLKRRPDVLAAQNALTGALGNRALAKLDLFPSFSLSPGIGIEKQDRPRNSFSTSFWSLGIGMLMPILDRGRLMVELRASDARVAQAIADYEKAVQVAYGEADSVLARLMADHRQLDGITANAHDAAAYDRTMRRGEIAGVLDPDVAIAARRQRQSADIDLVRARVLVLRRSIQGFKALGGGWDDAMACGTARGCGS